MGNSMPQPEYHSLRCPNSHGSVLLGFQRLSHTVNGVWFELVDCPTLHCPECGYSTLPGAIQTSLEKETANALAQDQTSGRITFKNNSLRFTFCREINLLYDYRDHYYLPGLFRSEADGFLTQAFFRAHVLHKYRNTPGYHVDMASDSYGAVYFPNGAYLSFGINRQGQVITWLCDLDSLPVHEQYYWRSENIEFLHDMASEFYDGQNDVIFIEPSREQQMFTARAELLQSSNILIGRNISPLDTEITAIPENF
jgi:hypothetical protein